MYIQCTVYSVHLCSVYSVLCTVQCTMYSIRCTMYSVYVIVIKLIPDTIIVQYDSEVLNQDHLHDS